MFKCIVIKTVKTPERFVGILLKNRRGNIEVIRLNALILGNVCGNLNKYVLEDEH